MQEEKNRIERVLGAISQPELIQKVLTFALSVSYWKSCCCPVRTGALGSALLVLERCVQTMC